MSASLHTEGPTSTTKALLVIIVTPRLFSTKKKTEVTAPSEIVVDTDDGESNHSEECNASAETNSDPIETESNEEGAAEDSKTEESEEKEEEKDEEPTPEEEAAVKKVGKDPDDNEVNVEELLRIAFQSLLEEFYLLGRPSYTAIHRRIEDTKDKSSGFKSIFEPLYKNHDSKPTWIQVQVMARPSSLETILDRLERIGVGTDIGSVSVFKAELCRTASPYADMPASTRDEKEGSETSPFISNFSKSATKSESDSEKDDIAKKEQEKIRNERIVQEAEDEWKNGATKLKMEQVREQIVEMSAFSFDFIALLIVSSILAGIGLITDNTVVIVASMLVSPIMGPVLGCTFGTRIMDWALVQSSVKNEVLALAGGIFIGVLVGIPSSFTSLAEDTWPSNEMEIRGETSGLLTGIAIAIPSGMGVCLSILDGNTSSLVGVAISASLLPPAVNTGVCLIYSFLLAIGSVSNRNGKSAHDFAVIGGISLALTIINILCIWLSGIVMFEIKKVAPTRAKSAFWSKDLKAASKRKNNSEGGQGQFPPINIQILQEDA